MTAIDHTSLEFKPEPFANKKVQEKFSGYPLAMQKNLLILRQLIFECAESEIEETLKWGEPSYLSAKGSTIRMDYKEKAKKQYALYFNCQTKLIDTFKELYPTEFQYEGNRAMVFYENEKINTIALRNCIQLALNYHSIKHLPLLGGSLLSK